MGQGSRASLKSHLLEHAGVKPLRAVRMPFSQTQKIGIGLQNR
jgi:hypothetical protein